ncbi:MAG TPA: hypothetical protein DEH78_16685 [Solibacterales bacterium]|nr:hypothetical protein [Bryobacterales bacterium]
MVERSIGADASSVARPLIAPLHAPGQEFAPVEAAVESTAPVSPARRSIEVHAPDRVTGGRPDAQSPRLPVFEPEAAPPALPLSAAQRVATGPIGLTPEPPRPPQRPVEAAAADLPAAEPVHPPAATVRPAPVQQGTERAVVEETRRERTVVEHVHRDRTEAVTVHRLAYDVELRARAMRLPAVPAIPSPTALGEAHAAAEAHTVEVHIGRVDVRASAPRSEPPSRTARPQTKSTLDEYLRGFSRP